MDGNGDLEVIIGSGYIGLGPANACSNSPTDADCHGALYAWHHDGTPVSGFPTWPTEKATGKNGFIRSSPVVGDVDGDGDLEILATLGWEVIVVGKNGVQEDGLQTDYTTVASPAIGDLDGDGRTNVVIGSAAHFDDSHGYVFNFEFDDNSFNANALPWPMFHRDAQNSGLAPSKPSLKVSPLSLETLHEFGDTSAATFKIEISNPGEGTVDWSATAPAGIKVTPSSGSVSDSTTVVVSVDTTAYASPPGTLGSFNLGNIQITGTANGQSVDGSPASVSVRLVVVDQITRVYLPLMIK